MRHSRYHLKCGREVVLRDLRQWRTDSPPERRVPVSAVDHRGIHSSGHFSLSKTCRTRRSSLNPFTARWFEKPEEAAIGVDSLVAGAALYLSIECASFLTKVG